VKRAYLVTWLSVGLVVVGNALIIMSGLPIGFKIYLTQMVIVVLLHVAAAIILVLALQGFRERLKRMYLLLSASFILLVLGLVQGVVMALFGLNESTFALLGGDDVLLMIYAALAYFSLRILASQVGIQSMLLKPWITFGFAAAAGIVAVVLPSPRADYPQYVIDIVAFNTAAGAVLLSAVAILAFKVLRQISPLYKSAVRWVFMCFVSGGIVTGGSAIAQVYLEQSHWFWSYGVMYTVYNFTAVAGLVLALKFSKIAYAEEEIMKHAHGDKAGEPTDSVDVVVAVAQLASNPHSIEHILNKLRKLTASLGTKEQKRTLSSDQQAQTASIYIELENFLINQEPVRKFTGQQLRQMLDIRYKEAVQEPVFWGKLGPAPAIPEST
jgi:hypothetical protein